MLQVGKEGWASVPQDVFRQLSANRAMQGMLRLRTSEEFTTAAAFGNLVRDAQYDNLYHIAACDEGSCFAFDFGFTDVASFETDDGDEGANLQPPRVQMAFSYCARPSVDDSAAAQPMVKRLRVQTVEFGVARTPVRRQRRF